MNEELGTLAAQARHPSSRLCWDRDAGPANTSRASATASLRDGVFCLCCKRADRNVLNAAHGNSPFMMFGAIATSESAVGRLQRSKLEVRSAYFNSGALTCAELPRCLAAGGIVQRYHYAIVQRVEFARNHSHHVNRPLSGATDHQRLFGDKSGKLNQQCKFPAVSEIRKVRVFPYRLYRSDQSFNDSIIFVLQLFRLVRQRPDFLCDRRQVTL